ncbi:MAG: phosphoribosyltransferase [Pyrinomonadaceae bacterium]|nr:phosphoribosyltransferase [Pyrinomonadaceae bacterium]
MARTIVNGFNDREEGGRALAARLADYKDRADTVVLALPRGGVPVGFEVSKALNLPLDVLLVRKLGVPGQEELAFGAISSGDITVFNESIVNALKIPDSMISKVIEKEKAELKRRENIYRPNRSAYDLGDRTVIIVDDGLATGATMRAAVAAVRSLGPRQIVVAAPVASKHNCQQIGEKTDDLCVCVMTPEPFYGVGKWYRDFGQTSDEEVCRLLEESENLLAKVV